MTEFIYLLKHYYEGLLSGKSYMGGKGGKFTLVPLVPKSVSPKCKLDRILGSKQYFGYYGFLLFRSYGFLFTRSSGFDLLDQLE